jgi:hypothetical protein
MEKWSNSAAQGFVISGKPNLDRFGPFGEPDLVNSLPGFTLDQYSLGHFGSV